MLKNLAKPTGEKLTEGEKKVVLCLEKENRKNYSEIARETGLSVQGTKNIIRRLRDEGVIKDNPNSKYERYSLDREKVHIRRFSTDLFKELMLPVTIGIFLTMFLAFTFKENALLFLMGGVIVFVPQLLYTLYRILATEEEIDIYRVSTPLKPMEK
ncbi:MAG: winged helix-turn-helix transcriptional regulator [Candidatus Bathyarchaeia archaeon]